MTKINVKGHSNIPDINECASNPCTNGASCVDAVNSYSCSCKAGYTGDRCETDINECASNLCMNGATCSDKVNAYSCVCGAGYTGDRCETEVDKCASSPCSNGGRCVKALNAYTCQCVSGFTGMQCDGDADQCESNPCQNGATCQEAFQKFTCQCSSGYSGIQCETDVNECGSDPCQNGGTCHDEMNQFSCTCASGYTGQKCETETNECDSNPCLNGGTCTDAVNQYSCSCVSGYAGINCETDIDECASSPCQNYGTCIDEVNAYSCACTTDIYTGSHCEEVIRRRLYQYGSGHGDKKLKDDGDKTCDTKGKFCSSGFIKMPLMQVFESQFKTVKITTNGYVTMGASYKSRIPTKFEDMLSASKKVAVKKSGFAMFTPMWTDADASKGDVFYHVYNRATEGVSDDNKARARHAMTMAAEDVKQFGGLSDVDPSWVMVITWADMIPRGSYNQQYDRPNTFQLVIIYDASRWSTFVMFSYDKTGWDTALTTRGSMIGYYVTQYGDDNTMALGVSDTPISFRLADLEGNTGEKGRYMYRVASGNDVVNYAQKCEDWYNSQSQILLLIQTTTTLSCPCDRRLAKGDRRWRKDRDVTGSTMTCYYQRNLRITKATQYCCYDTRGSLLISDDGAAGHMFAYHPRFFKNMHKKYDLEPKEWCCSNTDNCFLYLAARPIDYCWKYAPPCLGWFFGDPHIRTLDGLEYTFNGLGEYMLIATDGNDFTLQGRTLRALDGDNKAMQATVFSAFAARDSNSDRFHVQMSKTRNGFVIYVDDNDITSWFTGAVDDAEESYNGLSVSRKSATSVEATFSSGFTLAIGVNAEQLDITVGAPPEFMNKTRGLMGVFNSDPNDDLLPADGGAVLKSNASERDIFSKFGQTWRIERADSLFRYTDGNSFETFDKADFEPLFLQEVLDKMSEADRKDAKDKCKGNNECIFDLAVTGKEEAAAATLATNTKNTEDAQTLANHSPVISVTSVVNSTLGDKLTINVTVSDADDDDKVTLQLESDLPTGAVFDNSTGIFTWTPTTKEAVNISFSASDDRGGVAPTAVVTVNLCDCSGNGDCLFGEVAEGEKLASTFRIVACKCHVGYTGSTCADDIDGCEDNPCTVGTNCTDLTPTQQSTQSKAFECSDCPNGYFEDDGICVDVNECEQTSPPPSCTDIELCVNTPGGFTCMCKPGYRKKTNEGTCEDIDECTEKSSGCEQDCANSPGSFQCSCSGGYTINSDGITCKQDANLNTQCKNDKPDCKQGCRFKSGQSGPVECFCNDGFSLGTDEKSCDDVNECTDTGNRHKCDTTCINTVGGYNCSCADGYLLNDDMRTCRTCPKGQWGAGCLKLCNCESPDTTCDPSSGCSKCPTGFKGGDCSVDLDECTDNVPCDANSNCTNTPGLFRCDCHEGYTQLNVTTCKERDECESDPCQNGATCEDKTKSYSCNCVTGYTGNNCQTDINECENSPCKNGGSCSDLVNRYRCSCKRGFTGVNCETDYDDCSSNPCMNGATCQDGSDSYTCPCLPGYSGTNCETDIDECSSAPCQNGATCSDGVNGYSCKCTTGYEGDNCKNGVAVTTETTTTPIVTTTTPLIPPTEQTRVNIAIRLTSKNYTKDLEDKTSDAYNGLKKEVVKTLKDVLTTKLDAGTFDIVDVTFSDGSIVVNYELAVKKAAATETLNTIVDTVKKATEDGSFGNFTIDPTSIQASKSDLFSFYGKFTITNREYNDQLSEPSSTTYKNMFDEVKQTVRKVFVDSDIGNDVVAVTEITFSKGSIIVSYQLVLKEKFTLVHLTAIMKKYLQEHGGKLGSFEVKADSIDFSAVPWKKTAPLVPIIIGTVIGVVFIILVIILVFHIVKTVRKHRVTANSPVGDEMGLPNYGMRQPVNRRFWQDRGHSMQEPQASPLHDAYNHQRMSHISKALGRFSNINWGIVRNFANHSGPEQQEKLHRRPETNEWAWTAAR